MPIELNIDEKGDWLIIQPNLTEFRRELEFDSLPRAIHWAFSTWISQHPERRIRTTLGILEQGSLVALHVWHDPC